MKTRITLAAMLATCLAGLSLVATPAYATPSGSSVRHTAVSHRLGYGAMPPSKLIQPDAAAPQTVNDEIARIEAKGGRILAVVHADYRRVPTVPSAVLPQAFPTGCGLYVIVYHSGSYVTNSSLTACTMPTTATEMYGGLARSRFFGWEQVDDGSAYNEGEASLSLEINYYCGGTGTHNFQGVTNGQLILNGETYDASAWDEVDNVNC